MLREVCIVIFSVCCIFLSIPLSWVFFHSGIGFVLPFILLAIVLAYAGYDVIRLVRNSEGDVALTFMLLLIGAVLFSLIALFNFGFHLMPRGYS